MGIDWDAVRRKGEQGLLTARETDALVALSKSYTVDGYLHNFAGEARCCWCQHLYPKHDYGCPISVLEEVSDGQD